MPVFFSYSAVFAFGGLLYGLVEILFRGYTHWTMLVAGGVCFTLLFLINRMENESVWKKWIMGGAVITAVEFVAGCIVNLRLGWEVWDYSGHPLNLMGQICLLFSVGWVGLSIPAMKICSVADRILFGKRGGAK